MSENTGKYAGMSVLKAREDVVKDLQEMGMIEKIDDNYSNAVTVCYKGGHVIEPTVLPNWFIKVDSLKKQLELEHTLTSYRPVVNRPLLAPKT